jgi:hypothetical protein
MVLHLDITIDRSRGHISMREDYTDNVAPGIK